VFAKFYKEIGKDIYIKPDEEINKEENK